MLLIVEALIAAEHQFAHVLAFMAQAIADGMMTASTELQAQVAALVHIVQGVQRHEALNFAEKQTEDALRFEAGLQLQAQLLAQLRETGGPLQKWRLLTETQALQFGAVEVNCIGLGR